MTRFTKDGPGGRRPPGPAGDKRPGALPRTPARSRRPPETETRVEAGPARSKAGERPRGEADRVTIWGFHAVRAALRATGREVIRLSATEAAAERLQGEIAARGLTPVIVANEVLSARLPRDAVHQGVILEARPAPALDLADLPDRGLVLVLDQITDPHNVGAILRTAAAFDAVGLVTTERRAPEMTGVLAKAASGGLEHVPVVTVVNLARALEALGDRGFQRIGLDSEGAVPLETVARAEAVALVLGAEGKGLRRLTRENCDVIAKLDFPGPIRSLNVSNACAAALTMLHLSGRT